MTATADAGALRDRFNGRVLLPHEPGYDDARTVFNGMIDKRPAVIAQCADVPDVVTAVAFARDHDLPLSVRSGGHSVAGMSVVDDGVMIDMRGLNAVAIDPQARTATVGGGTSWGQFDAAAGRYDLATTGGRVSTTGVAGLTLGGGSGWIERKFGLACDNLLSVELVTAEGHLVTANPDSNPELFWALRGGGGNFGIATSFTFQLHELPVMTLALLFFRPDAGPDVVRRYRDFLSGAPEEVGGAAVYMTGPPEPFVPEHLKGRLTFTLALMYTGNEVSARQVLRPMLDIRHEGEMIAEMPYPELQSSMDDPPGYRNYWSVEYFNDLPDAAIDVFCARAHDMVVPSPSQTILIPWGGAVARGADPVLVARQARWAVHPFALWDDPADDERAISAVRGLCAGLKPYATGGVYLNFTGQEGDDRVVAGFGRRNYDRLVAVKTQWDPDNVFRLNHNIRPVSRAG